VLREIYGDLLGNCFGVIFAFHITAPALVHPAVSVQPESLQYLSIRRRSLAAPKKAQLSIEK
jgi:hypothetical protein